MGSRLGKTLKLLLLLWVVLATGLGLAWVVELIDQQSLIVLLIKSGLLVGVLGAGALVMGLFLSAPPAEKSRRPGDPQE